MFMKEKLVAESRLLDIVRPGGLAFGRVLSRLGPGLNMFSGAPLASPLALPFCAPFLLDDQTVMAVDGANCFDLYRLTEWARRKQIDSLALLRRLRVARAFTPFQLATILHHLGGEMERHGATRLVITGFPDCLFDEELNATDARSTFARCQANLAALGGAGYTIMLFTDPPRHLLRERGRFFDALAGQADQVFEVRNTHHGEFIPVKARDLLPESGPPGGAGR